MVKIMSLVNNRHTDTINTNTVQNKEQVSGKEPVTRGHACFSSGDAQSLSQARTQSMCSNYQISYKLLGDKFKAKALKLFLQCV